MTNNKAYSEEIMNAVKEILQADKWRFSLDENAGVFRFTLRLKGKISGLNYFIKIKKLGYVVYGVSPVNANFKDKQCLAAMAEFICRANYGLINGNFEMDMNDGDLRYKCYVPCGGIAPTREMVLESLYCPALMFDRYSEGIIDVLFRDVSPKKAIGHIEDRDASESDEEQDETDNEVDEEASSEGDTVNMDLFDGE